MARDVLVPLAAVLAEAEVVVAVFQWGHACPACETHDDGPVESWEPESAGLFDGKLLHQFQTDALLGEKPLPRGAPSAHVGQEGHCLSRNLVIHEETIRFHSRASNGGNVPSSKRLRTNIARERFFFGICTQEAMINVSEAQWDSRTSGTLGGRGEFYECGDVFEDARAAQTSDGSTRRPKTCDEQST